MAHLSHEILCYNLNDYGDYGNTGTLMVMGSIENRTWYYIHAHKYIIHTHYVGTIKIHADRHNVDKGSQIQKSNASYDRIYMKFKTK